MKYSDTNVIWKNYSTDRSVWDTLAVGSNLSLAQIAQLFRASSAAMIIGSLSSAVKTSDTILTLTFSGGSGFIHPTLYLYYSSGIIRSHVKSGGSTIFQSLSSTSSICYYAAPFLVNTLTINVSTADIGLSTMAIWDCYKFKNTSNVTETMGILQGINIRKNGAPTLSKAGTEALPSGGDSVTNDDLPDNVTSSPKLAQTKSYLDRLGGIVRTKRFLVENSYLSGYSLLSTRSGPEQESGNYIYADNTNNQPRTALNKTYMFNFKNQLYYPVYIYCGQDRNSVAVYSNYVMANGTRYELNSKDRVVCYESVLTYSPDINFIPEYYYNSGSEIMNRNGLTIGIDDSSGSYARWIQWGPVSTSGISNQYMGPFYCATYNAITPYEVDRSNNYSEITSSSDFYATAISAYDGYRFNYILKFRWDNTDHDYAEWNFTGDGTPYGANPAKWIAVLGYCERTRAHGYTWPLRIQYGYNHQYIWGEDTLSSDEFVGTITSRSVTMHTGNWNGGGVTWNTVFEFNSKYAAHGDHRPFYEQYFYYLDVSYGRTPQPRRLFPGNYSSETNGINAAYRESPKRIVWQTKRNGNLDWIWIDDDVIMRNTNSSELPHKYQYILWKSVL